jgi:hypothetical protein
MAVFAHGCVGATGEAEAEGLEAPEAGEALEGAFDDAGAGAGAGTSGKSIGSEVAAMAAAAAAQGAVANADVSPMPPRLLGNQTCTCRSLLVRTSGDWVMMENAARMASSMRAAPFAVMAGSCARSKLFFEKKT